jgi:hypothetical protein
MTIDDRSVYAGPVESYVAAFYLSKGINSNDCTCPTVQKDARARLTVFYMLCVSDKRRAKP